MLNLTNIMIGSPDPKALAAFYEKVLEKKPEMIDGDWYGFSAGACFISMGPHDKVNGQSQNPERLMINFDSDQVKQEFERIKSLGAKVIAEPYSMGAEGEVEYWIATLADPDGNYFQLTTPWDAKK
ncbi:MAG: VOC family protein [bacterium]|nr:VOC family protein [bacterium]